MSKQNRQIKRICLCPSLQELKAQEEASLEELLQSVKAQEDFFKGLPSWEEEIAQIEQLINQMEKDLEAYLFG